MKSLFDKLNLGALERRIVVGAMLMLFIVVNGMFVWPQFKDWPHVQLRAAPSPLADGMSLLDVDSAMRKRFG